MKPASIILVRDTTAVFRVASQVPTPGFGSLDPVNPQTLNRYTYALNNPLAFTDPSGTDPVWVHDIELDIYFSVSQEDYDAYYKGVKGFEITTNTGPDGIVIPLTELQGSYANDPATQG
jgi:hypothetical protein